MIRKGICAALFMTGLVGTGVAYADLACIEVGQLVEGVAQARDRGQSKSRLKAIMQEDSSFTANDKRAMAQYVDLVYQNSDIPPKALANIAIDTCYRPKNSRPPIAK